MKTCAKRTAPLVELQAERKINGLLLDKQQLLLALFNFDMLYPFRY